MPNLKINNKTYSGVSEVHIPLADGSGNEDFAYINSETKSITENGTHDVKHYGTVNVNVPTEGEGIIPSGTKTITENGTYDVTEYANAKVEVPSEEPNIQSLNVTANGTYTAPSGIDGYSPITVNVPTESDIELQQKTVTPSETAQTITPDSGYDGLASVSVGAISKTYVGSGVTKKSAQTYTPGTSNQTISAGQYLNGAQTIKGDANLIADNIKKGISIFDVAGTYEGTGGLPDGVTALATGTVLYESTAYAPYIEHGLSVVPNFYFVVAEGAASIAEFSGRMIAHLALKQTLEGYSGYYATLSVSSSGSVTNNTQPIKADNISDYFNETTIKPYGFFQTGKKYRWYAGTLNMIS